MLKCPVTAQHALVEIADGLFQCPECGAGPTEFWALSNVEVDDDVIGALCITWRPDLECYVLAMLSWAIDERGCRVGGRELHSLLMGYASTASELQETALPARSTDSTLLRLRSGMFNSPLGEKLVRKGGRGGKSEGASSPSESGESSPRRRRRAG